MFVLSVVRLSVVILSVVMLSDAMLNVVMLSVVMLIVVAQSSTQPFFLNHAWEKRSKLKQL